jgi:hypothetical protein
MLAEALDAKRLDILHETFPTMRRVAVLSGRPTIRLARDETAWLLFLWRDDLETQLTICYGPSPNNQKKRTHAVDRPLIGAVICVAKMGVDTYSRLPACQGWCRGKGLHFTLRQDGFARAPS